jgi:hypothetical protein
MKKISIVALIVCMFACLTPVFADHGKQRCSTCEYQNKCKSCGEKSCGKSDCPITSALMKKACFFLTNADDIGLNEDQVKRIKSISVEAKKQEILGKAQMKVAFIDMTSKLHEETVDVEGLNAMVDQFSAGMADSTKKTIQSYAELKSTLTSDQMAKAKKIWKKNKK